MQTYPDYKYVYMLLAHVRMNGENNRLVCYMDVFLFYAFWHIYNSYSIACHFVLFHFPIIFHI